MSSSPDIIKDASDALKPISDSGIVVMQGWYDKNIKDRHVTLSVQITIFSEHDELDLARKIKKIMKENDFSFEGRNADDSKPEDGIYMKAQRFSKFYEMEE